MSLCSMSLLWMNSRAMTIWSVQLITLSTVYFSSSLNLWRTAQMEGDEGEKEKEERHPTFR